MGWLKMLEFRFNQGNRRGEGMKQMCVTLSLHSGQIEGVDVVLPDGCKGVLLVFESKKAAREYWGNKVECVRLKFPHKGRLNLTGKKKRGEG